MNVTRVYGGVTYEDIPKTTNAELQNEFNYILAESITRKLLDKGIISEYEFDRIMEKNKRSFSPFLSQI